MKAFAASLLAALLVVPAARASEFALLGEAMVEYDPAVWQPEARFLELSTDSRPSE